MKVALPRRLSAVERVAVGALALAPLALIYPPVHEATGLGPVCPLRTVTGIPCPFCGGTTSATALAGGRLADALAANPFVPVLGVGLVAVLLLFAARAAGLAAPPRPWSERRRRALVMLATAAMAASWVVQLHRFDWL